MWPEESEIKEREQERRRKDVNQLSVPKQKSIKKSCYYRLCCICSRYDFASGHGSAYWSEYLSPLDGSSSFLLFTSIKCSLSFLPVSRNEEKTNVMLKPVTTWFNAHSQEEMER